MNSELTIKRTNSTDADFRELIAALDHELWVEMKEDQATYDQYNKVPNLDTVVIAYDDEVPAGCGCFKKFDDDTVEIKRMFVKPVYRGQKAGAGIVQALETWAAELNYRYAVLETGIRLKNAQRLYQNGGYSIIPNYGQYAGLPESVCMRKELKPVLPPSGFKTLAGVEYFLFEEDFIEENVRCIPMIVRFKMDMAGIKLKLAEWSKFKIEERQELALKKCGSEEEAVLYKNYLAGLVQKYTGKAATQMEVEKQPAWTDKNNVPGAVAGKAKEFDWDISIEQWKTLTDLQRFTLLKLCRPGHENKNFPIAVKEFKLIQ